jgi:hypothetical protein
VAAAPLLSDVVAYSRHIPSVERQWCMGGDARLVITNSNFSLFEIELRRIGMKDLADVGHARAEQSGEP